MGGCLYFARLLVMHRLASKWEEKALCTMGSLVATALLCRRFP
jgi:hypothetical protein